MPVYLFPYSQYDTVNFVAQKQAHENEHAQANYDSILSRVLFSHGIADKWCAQRLLSVCSVRRKTTPFLYSHCFFETADRTQQPELTRTKKSVHFRRLNSCKNLW